MKNETKIKYLAEILAFTFIFLIYTGPALASEISVGKVIKLVNESRTKQGLTPLTENETLKKVANDKLNDMINNHYFSHTSPSGKTPWSWFAKENYDYQYAGENLAINFTSAEKQHSAWMASPTHRKNILNSNYKEIGVAFGAGEIDGQMSLITVQEFGAKFAVANEVAKKNIFSTEEDKNLMKENENIVPQVLSIKDQELGKKVSDDYLGQNKSLSKQVWLDNAKEAGNNQSKIIDWMSFISILFFLASISLIPMAFLAVAFDKIIMLHEIRRYNE